MYLSVRRPYPAPWMEWAFVAKPSPFYSALYFEPPGRSMGAVLLSFVESMLYS